MAKIHFKITGVDCRESGQTQHEYTHQAACGYVRDLVTKDADKVNCEWCLESIHMISNRCVNKRIHKAYK